MSLARSSEDMQSRFLGGARTKMEQSIGSAQTLGAHLGEKMDSSESRLGSAVSTNLFGLVSQTLKSLLPSTNCSLSELFASRSLIL